jgi:ribose transport system substrate-binding protein
MQMVSQAQSSPAAQTRVARWLTALVLVLGGAGFFAGCDRSGSTASSNSGGSSSTQASDTSGGSGGAGGGSMRIAVIPKGTTHVFWKSVEAGAKQAGSELGVEIIWKGPLKESDRAEQIKVVQEFIAEGVNGIVLAPLDATALLAPVQSATGRKIPVVIFDSALNGEVGKDFVSLVATDNKKGGNMAGDELARVMGGKGKVVLLRYGVGSASTEQREAGFLEALAKHPDIQVIDKDHYAGATVGEAQKMSENLLDKLKEADGIFCPNESSTQGMLNVLVANGLAGNKKFVGFDTSSSLLDALNAGQIQALVAQNPRNMGYLAVTTLVKQIKGEAQAPPYVDTGCALVTKENLDTPDIKKLLSTP